MENHFYHIRWAPLSVTIITHVHMLHNGSYANDQRANDPGGKGTFGLQGHGWATKQLYKLLASWLNLEIFLSFPHYKSMEVYDPEGVANLNPRGIVRRNYEDDH